MVVTTLPLIFLSPIDTDKYDGFGDCVTTCPVDIFEVVDEDPNDPMREEPVAMVAADKKKKLKYECGPCKPPSDRPPLLCVDACKAEAIFHS